MRPITPLATGVFILIMGLILGTVIMGLCASTGGDLGAFIMGDMSIVPDWFLCEVFLSPQDGSQIAAMVAFGIIEFMGYEFDMPSYINLGTLALSQAIWTLIPLTFSFLWFEKRDVRTPSRSRGLAIRFHPKCMMYSGLRRAHASCPIS